MATSATLSPTRLHPHDPDHFDAGIVIGTMLPGCIQGRTIGADGVYTLRLSHPASGSWASFTPGNREHIVRQHGTRRLWDDLETTYRWWTGLNRPERQRFGITATPERQYLWLDEPDGPSWEIPAQ